MCLPLVYVRKSLQKAKGRRKNWALNILNLQEKLSNNILQENSFSNYGMQGTIPYKYYFFFKLHILQIFWHSDKYMSNTGLNISFGIDNFFSLPNKSLPARKRNVFHFIFSNTKREKKKNRS